MPGLTPLQRRALSAAAGVVGRPRLHAGLLLALSVACGPSGEADPEDPASTGDVPGTTTATTAFDPAVTTSSATDGASAGASTSSGDASTSAGDSTAAGDASTASGDASTSGGTLLTDASTTTATTTGATDTDATTGATDTDATTDATTGGLDDCLDPRTQEVDWACCEAQQWQPAPQCTPWGPPAPPTATRDRLARARAARRGLLA